MCENIMKVLQECSKLNRPPITVLRDASICPQLLDIIMELNIIVENLPLVSLMRPINLRTLEMWWKDEGTKGGCCPINLKYNVGSLKKAANLYNVLQRMLESTRKITIADGFNPASSIMREMVIRRITGAIQNTKIAKAILEDKSSESTAKEVLVKYPDLEDWLLTEAETVVGQLTEIAKKEKGVDILLSHIKFDAPKLQKFFLSVLKAYGLRNWRVELSKTRKIISTRYACLDRVPRIYIPIDLCVNAIEAMRLASHEIECHVLDTMNAMILTHGLCKLDNELLYEGKAIYSDVMIDSRYLGKPWVLLKSSLLIIGIQMAKKGASFSEVAKIMFERLYDEFHYAYDKATDEAFKIAVEIFYGCKKTSSNSDCYAFTRGAVYLRGYVGTYKLAEAGFYNYLMLGASTLEDLSAIVKHYSVDDLSNIPYVHHGLAEKIIQQNL